MRVSHNASVHVPNDDSFARGPSLQSPLPSTVESRPTIHSLKESD